MAEDSVAIVTGAGSGIGREAALALGSQRYRLVLVGRSVEKLESTAGSLQEAGGLPPRVIAADLTDPDACERVVREAAEKLGRIDAIANVAGDAPNMPIDQLTREVWRRCIDTNLSAVVHLTAAAWPVFRRQKSGVVVNVSSLASIDPFPGFAAYAAAKAGVNLFTLVTAREGAEIGVKAVAIAPGAVETPMLRSIFDEVVVPRERALHPSAVARIMVDCITGRRLFAPGEVIPVPSPA